MVFRFFSGTLEPRVDDALDFSGEFFMEGFGLVTASWGFFKVDLQCYWCEIANLGDQSSFFDFIETESFECYSYFDGVRGAAHPNKFLGFNSLLLPKLLRGTRLYFNFRIVARFWTRQVLCQLHQFIIRLGFLRLSRPGGLAPMVSELHHLQKYVCDRWRCFWVPPLFLKDDL